MYGIEELKKMANTIRYDTLKAIHIVGSGHPGGSISAVEILTTLYFYKMHVDVKNPKWDDRDRFVLSKGHAAPALFATLAHKGFFDINEMKKLRLTGGMLQATPNLNVPGCDMSSGSLGQNLSVASGMAYAGKYDNKSYKVYVLLGDGELQEGQNWEAAMFAPNKRLGNLVAIIDNNHVQMCGTTDEIMNTRNIEDKFLSFGWNVKKVNGHDIQALISVLDSIGDENDAPPTMIIADTIKGKGVSFMEGKAAWHGGAPNDEQMAQIDKELEGGTL